jgi:ankyrin repeat protein
MITFKCPHCDNEINLSPLSLLYYSSLFYSSKKVKCPTCGKTSFLSDESPSLPYIIFLVPIFILASFSLAFQYVLPIESNFLFFSALMSIPIFLYKMSKTSCKLSKIGPKKGILKVSLFASLFLAIVFLSTMFIKNIVFKLSPIEEILREREHAINNEAKYILPGEDVHKYLRSHLDREEAWSQKCQSEGGVYCRLLSRIYWYEGNHEQESSLLEKGCAGKDILSCYRLYMNKSENISSSLDEIESLLVEHCKISSKPLCCSCLGTRLIQNGSLKKAFSVLRNQCVNYKDEYSCQQIARHFSYQDNTRFYEDSCKQKISESCLNISLSLLGQKQEIAQLSKKELKKLAIGAARLGQTESIEKLLEAGVDVNTSDKDGNSLLSIVSVEGYLDIATILIKNGADINLSNENGLTPIMRLTFYPWKSTGEMFTFLLQNGADLSKKDKHNWKVLQYSVDSSDVQFFSTILKKDIRTIPKGKVRFIEALIKRSDYKKLKVLFEYFPLEEVIKTLKPCNIITYAISISSRKVIEVIFHELDKIGVNLQNESCEISLKAHQRGDKEILSFLEARGISEPKSFFPRFKARLYKYIHSRQ